ncbi:MAG: ThiF family adenylyltransferase [Burkholderiales bacterium]|nr:ThiF family adenylyltransferase [Burkholderiales bacterium]
MAARQAATASNVVVEDSVATPAAGAAAPGATRDGDLDADLERRFGGLRRLWGDAAYQRVRAARVAVVGVGGVGSWAVEALARCGVAELVLIDFDQVAESNINRQVQALGDTVGAAKVTALARRIADIHPGCRVHEVEQFVEAPLNPPADSGVAPQPGNWPAVLPIEVDVVIDACDQGAAKLTLAAWSLAGHGRLVIAGAAGGKTRPQAIDVADLAEVTHDPLLATLRQRVRRLLRDQAGAALEAGRPLAVRKAKAKQAKQANQADLLGLRCVFSREAVVRPGTDASCALDVAPPTAVDDVSAATPSAMPGPTGLNCAGYGSSVMVTASMGLAAAEEALRLVRGAR